MAVINVPIALTNATTLPATNTPAITEPNTINSSLILTTN
jgi:hypothetical protein